MEKKEKQNELESIRAQREASDKRLLNAEIFIVIYASAILIACVLVAGLVTLPVWARIVLIVAGFLQFLPAMFYCIKIEQVAGFFECSKCHHKHVPTFKQACLSMHCGRTRYMKCPKCGEKTWQKKVLSDQ